MLVTVKWSGGKKFESTNEEGAKFMMEPKRKAGGSGDHGSPTDHLLGALASCSGIDVVSILEKMRQQVRAFGIEVDGTQADDFPKYFKSIKIKYILEGENLDRSKVEQAVELSEKKYCSVRATLSERCVVTREIVIKQ